MAYKSNLNVTLNFILSEQNQVPIIEIYGARTAPFIGSKIQLPIAYIIGTKSVPIAYIMGSSIVKMVLLSSSDLREMLPLCLSIILLVIASPRPVPTLLSFVLPPDTNG